MKKIKYLLLALAVVFAGMTNVNAATATPELTTLGTKNILLANGTPITIEEPTTAGMGATVKWEGGEIEVPADVTIIGGYHNDAVNKVSTSITMNGGTVKNIFGGGLHISYVTDANIVMNGGKVTSSIMGGGYEEFVNCGQSDFNAVTEAQVMSSTTKVENTVITINGGNLDGAMIFGGGGAHAYTETAIIKLNEYEGKISYLVAGGSNGYTGSSEIIMNNGEVGVVQSVNRGTMDTANIEINGGKVDTAYVGGETDPTVTGTFNEANMVITGGEVANVEVGQNGIDANNSSISAKDNITLTYNKNTVTNIDETQFSEQSVMKTIKLTIIAEGEEFSDEIPLGTKFTNDDVIEIKKEINRNIEAEGLKFDDFYKDANYTEVYDMTTEFTEDTTVYAKFMELQEDDGTQNPETADISLYGMIITILFGVVGLSYTIKKRKFD